MHSVMRLTSLKDTKSLHFSLIVFNIPSSNRSLASCAQEHYECSIMYKVCICALYTLQTILGHVVLDMELHTAPWYWTVRRNIYVCIKYTNYTYTYHHTLFLSNLLLELRDLIQALLYKPAQWGYVHIHEQHGGTEHAGG